MMEFTLVNFIIRIYSHFDTICSFVEPFLTTYSTELSDFGDYEIHSIRHKKISIRKGTEDWWYHPCLQFSNSEKLYTSFDNGHKTAHIFAHKAFLMANFKAGSHLRLWKFSPIISSLEKTYKSYYSLSTFFYMICLNIYVRTGKVKNCRA